MAPVVDYITGEHWRGSIAMRLMRTPSKHGAGWPGCMTAMSLTATFTSFKMRQEPHTVVCGLILRRCRRGSVLAQACHLISLLLHRADRRPQIRHPVENKDGGIFGGISLPHAEPLHVDSMS